MTWHRQLKSLNDITDLNYIGYLWLSDESQPRLIEQSNINQYELDGKPAHPFIREAFLYDEKAKVSISIQHIPGRYLINVFDLNQLPPETQITEKKILSHKAIGNFLKFKEIWLPETEELCNNWPVLNKKASVFCGIE